MTTYVMRDGKLVDKSTLFVENVGTTNVISDSMDALRHMGTGQYYESKSEFRKATKASGCIEYGNEVPTLLKPRQRIPLDRVKRREDIRRALYEIRNGIRK